MEEKKNSSPWVTVIRGLARIGSIATITFWSGMLIAELVGGNFGSFNSSTEVVHFILCPGGVCAGMIIAWKREGLGGLVTTGSIIAFHFFRPDLLFDPTIDGLALPGVLFLICAVATRGISRRQ